MGKERRSWSRLQGCHRRGTHQACCGYTRVCRLHALLLKLLSAPPVWRPTGTTASSQPRDLQVLGSRGEELPEHSLLGTGETAAGLGSPHCGEVFQSRRKSSRTRGVRAGSVLDGAAQTSRCMH